MVSDGNQAYLPAFQNAASENPWIPSSQQNSGRAESDRQPPRQGPPAPRVVAADLKRFGLGPDRRLRQKAEFERLLREGSRRSLDGFTFYIGRRTGGDARLGMLVTRKHAARATDRNGLKRCIREAFRLEQATLGSIDLLVRPPYGARGSSRMIERLRALFQKIGGA